MRVFAQAPAIPKGMGFFGGASLSRLAPTIGTDYAKAADVLRVIAAGLHAMPLPSPPTPAAKPPQVPACRPPRLSRHRQTEAARAWALTRLASWPADRAPPSAVADWEAARIEIPGVARSIMLRQRPPEWKLSRGRRPKSPKT